MFKQDLRATKILPLLLIPIVCVAFYGGYVLGRSKGEQHVLEVNALTLPSDVHVAAATIKSIKDNNLQRAIEIQKARLRLTLGMIDSAVSRQYLSRRDMDDSIKSAAEVGAIDNEKREAREGAEF